MATTHKIYKNNPMSPRRVTVVDRYEITVKRDEENLWENPPEATPAMKRAIQYFQGRLDSNEPWDGSFSL